MEDKDKFYTSSNEQKNKALADMSESISKSNQAVAGFYTNLEDNISVRPPFGRRNYERFRPGESIPTKDSEIMLACRDSYEKVGLIRSVVDLMSEMAIEGLTLVSTNKNTENFFRAWMKKTNLIEKAEKFVNYFIVEGNVVVRRKYGNIDTPAVRRMKREKAIAQESGSIPVDYIFYDPSTIDLIGGEAALFTGIKQWALKVNSVDIAEVKKLVSSGGQNYSRNIPKEILDVIESDTPYQGGYNGSLSIPIDMDSLYVSHYKKKDSDIWAKSFIYSILHDVIYNEKLRIAKISALDSFYNSVRLWRLGDHKEEILPDVGSINKLANILENHSGGTMDIIWDSMIDYEQYFPPVEKLQNFEENYESMLIGLGIHKSLIGGDESPSAAASAFIGLRNVLKRIDAVRRALSGFVQNEIDIVCEELGFQNKPVVKYKLDDLFEQSSYFRLLVDLNDRNIISNRTIVEKVGEMYDIESERLLEEEDKRESSGYSPKYSPFIQSYIPDQNKEDFEESTSPPTSVPTEGVGTDSPMTNRIGRPPGAKDLSKRKNRRFQTMAELIIVGNRIQDKISKNFDEQYLKQNNIENKRFMTSKQRDNLEKMKTIALSQISIENIDSTFNMSDFDFDSYDSKFIKTCDDSIRSIGKSISLSEIKSIKSAAFAEKIIGEENV